MKKRKVAVIGTVGLPAKYIGFEILAAHLVENLGREWDFTVYCSGRQYKGAERDKTFKGAKLIYLPLQADGLQGLFYDLIGTMHAIFYADILMMMGVSASFMIPFVRLFTNKKIITSVDGYEWKSNKWGKPARIYRKVAEWIAIKCAHVNIANTESMQDAAALRQSNRDANTHETLKLAKETRYSFMDKPYAFKLCRIAPANNIEMILQSFVKTPQHQLVISGNWNKTEYGKMLRKTFAIFPNIHMLDPIYDQRELEMLRKNSFAYIHGNYPGGMDRGLLEAMFMGLPVVSLNTKDNLSTTEGKAIYFGSADELALIFNSTRIGDFAHTGSAMQETAQRRYTWKLVANKYEDLFVQVLQRRIADEADLHVQELAALSFDMGY